MIGQLRKRTRPYCASQKSIAWKGNTGLVDASDLGFSPGLPAEAFEITSPHTGATKIFYLANVTPTQFEYTSSDKAFIITVLNT